MRSIYPESSHNLANMDSGFRGACPERSRMGGPGMTGIYQVQVF